MSEACVGSVWLCNCDLGQMFKFTAPTVNLAGDKLLDKGRRAKGCSKVGSSFSGDINAGVSKELLCLGQVSLLRDEPCFSRGSDSSHIMALAQIRLSTN